MLEFSRYDTLVFSEHGADTNCYGLQVVRERMGQLGKSYDAVDPQITLHSSFWPEQLLDFLRWDARRPTRTPVLVGGNAPSTNPAPYLAAGCNVFLGDGECYSDDSSSLLAPGNTTPAPVAVVPEVVPVSGYVDEQKEGKSSRRYFCEISRGCRNRCAFCQYGWLKPYREAAAEHVEAALEFAQTKHVRVFAADRFQHSAYSRIRSKLDALGAVDTGSDASIRFLLKHPELLAQTRKIRTGIEGMSFRLRKRVGKPITDDDIVNVHGAAVAAGIKSFDWYMIYGLPTETDADADAFLDLLAKLETPLKGHTLAIHWNAFQPNACTPLQWAAPAVGYPAARLKRIGAARFSFKAMHVPLLTSDATVARRTLLTRAAGPETADMLKIMAFQPIAGRNVAAMASAYQKRVGVDPFGEWPGDKPFPWDQHVQYDKSRMRRWYDKIAF